MPLSLSVVLDGLLTARSAPSIIANMQVEGFAGRATLEEWRRKTRRHGSSRNGVLAMEHIPHPHIELRRKHGAQTTAKERAGFNGWLAVNITNIVGTMWCAYAFAILALVSLPEAIKGGVAPLVAWIAQTFLQLVLLSIIMVGQKVAAAASDKQALQTFKDAEALLVITDDLNKLLKQNTVLTEEIHELLKKVG